MKLISLFLSFAILFTSVAPSYAQALDAMEQERIGAGFSHWQSEFLTTSFNEVFEAEVAKHTPGVQLEDLKKLVDDLELFTDPGFDPSSLGIESGEEMTYERFAQEYKTQMKADAESAALLEMIGDDAEYQKLLNQEIKKAYAEYEADVEKFEAQEMEQMKSLIKQVWENRKKYSQDDQDWLAFEGMPFLYGIGLLDKATAESVAGVVRSVVKNAESDCSKVGVWTDIKAKVGAKADLNAQNARCERALKAIIPLGILGKAAKGKDRGDATLVGRFMISGYRGLAGAGVAMVGTQALLGLNGGQELATFLLRAPVDPEAEMSYALQMLILGLEGLSPIALYGDLEYEDAFYSYWTTKPLAYTFYEDDDGNVRNIFYDIGQLVAELSKEGDSTAKYVVEKVNRAQTAYHWDKMAGTGQLDDPMQVMGLNSKFFVAGTLKGGYEFDEELKRRCPPQERAAKKCGYKDGYYEYPNTHGVLMDYEWEDRLAWTCGAVNTARLPSWGNGGAVPLPLARGGYLAYRMRQQLIADDTIAPGLKAEIANTLARHYNKYARACNNIMEAVATGTQKHAYHTVTDKQWKAYNTQIVNKITGEVLRRKSDNEILSTNYTAATFEDSWKKGEANRAQAAKTQEATKWAQLAVDVILIFVTGGYSLVKGVIKAPVKMMKWGVRTIRAARAATASKNILKGLKILVRNHRFLKYGTTSLRKAMANRITYSWSRFKLGIKPEVLMTFGEKQTLNALRVKGAAAYSRELMHAARVGQQAMSTRAPLLARSAAEEVKWLNETMQAQKVLGIDGAKGFRIAANQVGKLSPTPANTIRLTQAVPQGYSVRVLEGAEVLGKSPSARLSAVELYEARNGVGFKKSAQRFLQGAKAKVHKVGQRMGLISEKSGSYVKVGQNYYKVGYGQTVVDLNGELRVAEIGQELVLDGQGIFVPYGKQAVRVVGRPMFADADLSLEQIAKNLKLNKTAVRPAVNGSSIAFEQRPFWKNGVTKKAVEGIKVAQGPLMEVDDFAAGYNRVRNAYTTRRVEVPQMQARWDAQLNGYVVEQGAGTRMVEELVPVQGRSRVAVAGERTLSPAELQAREHSQARAAYQRQQRVLREEGNLRASQELQASYMAQLEENSAKDAARAAYEATEKGKAAVAARQRKAFQWERFYNKVDKYTFGVGGKALRMLNQKATYMAAAMIMNTSSPAVANTAAAVSTLAADVRPVVTMVDPLMFERGGSMLVGGGRVVGGPSLITKGAPRFATAAEQAASVAKQGSQLSRQGAAFRVLQQQRAESVLTASMARLQAVSQGGFGLVDGVGYALNNAMNAFKYFSPYTAVKFTRNAYYIAHEKAVEEASIAAAVKEMQDANVVPMPSLAKTHVQNYINSAVDSYFARMNTGLVLSMNGLGQWVENWNQKRAAKKVKDTAMRYAMIAHEKAQKALEQATGNAKEIYEKVFQETYASLLAKDSSFTEALKAGVGGVPTILRNVSPDAQEVTLGKELSKSFAGQTKIVITYAAEDAGVHFSDDYHFVQTKTAYTNPELATEKANLIAEGILKEKAPGREALVWVFASAADETHKLAAFAKLASSQMAVPTIAEVKDVLKKTMRTNPDMGTKLTAEEAAALATAQELLLTETKSLLEVTAQEDLILGGIDESDLLKINKDKLNKVLYYTSEVKGVINSNATKDRYGNATYNNYAPVYLRHQDGTLSEKPMLFLLVQGDEGIRVPSGFVLAVDEQGKFKYINTSLRAANSDSTLAKIVSKIPLLKRVVNPEKHASRLLSMKHNERHATIEMRGLNATDLQAVMTQLRKRPGTLVAVLNLNEPDRFEAMMTKVALVAGSDLGASMSSQFKKIIPSSAVSVFFSGFGYISPLLANLCKPFMALFGPYRVFMIGLSMLIGISGFGMALGMYGIFSFDPGGTFLSWFGINAPVLELVLKWGAVGIFTTGAILIASVFSTQASPALKSVYPDSLVFATKNLSFTTIKGFARMLVSLVPAVLMLLFKYTGVGQWVGIPVDQEINWSVLVPIVTGVAIWALVDLNKSTRLKAEDVKKQQELAKKKESGKSTWQVLRESGKNADAVRREQLFNNVFKPKMKDISSRVAQIYMAYAPINSVMIGMAAGVMFPDIALWITITGSFLSWLARLGFNKMLENKLVNDDQLTGFLLPWMAVVILLITVLPYEWYQLIPWGLMYVATSTFGAAEQARIQNLIASYYRAEREKTRDDKTLSQKERDAALAGLKADEEDMKLRGAQVYNKSNSAGFYTIGGLIIAALLSADWGIFGLNEALVGVTDPAKISLLNKEAMLSAFKYVLPIPAFIGGLLVFKNWGMVKEGWDKFMHMRRHLTNEMIAKNNNVEILAALELDLSNPQAAKDKLTKMAEDLQKMVRGYANALTSEDKIAEMIKTAVMLNNRLKAYVENVPNGAALVKDELMTLRIIAHNIKVILNGNGIVNEVDKVEGNDVSAYLRAEAERLLESVHGVVYATDKQVGAFVKEIRDMRKATTDRNIINLTLQMEEHLQNKDGSGFEKTLGLFKKHASPELAAQAEALVPLLKGNLTTPQSVTMSYVAERSKKETTKVRPYEEAMNYVGELRKIVAEYKAGQPQGKVYDDAAKYYNLTMKSLDKYMKKNKDLFTEDPRVETLRAEAERLYNEIKPTTTWKEESRFSKAIKKFKQRFHKKPPQAPAY